jgi:EAL domain-containing protein (putative c-di-GMP-specific phosphodiesterase class I)/AmiR/NasT family two-component response regulator
MLISGDDAMRRAGAAPMRGPLERFAEARVVLVDDEPANLALLTQLLRRGGLRNLHAVEDSRDVLALVRELDPDLILLDLHMPGVDGYSLLAELREQAAGTYQPVLVLTADTTRQAITRALELGARDFLTKPFDIDEVTLRVRNLLETRALHMTLRHHNLTLADQLGTLEGAAESAHEARQSIIDRITKVLSNDGITMVFQPIMLADRTVIGCEALARFPQEPAQGPDRWFAEADSVGLGTELELCAVAAALRQLPNLPDDVFLAVNVSPSTAVAPELAALLQGTDQSRVVLELTEHVPVEDYDAVNAGLAALRSTGVRLALDDTGAGYAGFRHLLGLRPDVIKLDISLTRDIDHDPVRRALAAAIVAFAADVGAWVVAEGIETDSEMATLGGLNVPWLQGFRLGRPQDISSLLKLMER